MPALKLLLGAGMTLIFMMHFLKFLFIAIILFLLFSLFHSNYSSEITLYFNIPHVTQSSTPSFSVNYLIIGSFLVGFIFAAFLGAFRMYVHKVRKKELARLQERIAELEAGNPINPSSPSGNKPSDTLPSLVE